MRLKHIATLIISGYVLISCSSYNRILEGIYDKDQYSTEADIPKGKERTICNRSKSSTASTFQDSSNTL